MMLVTLQMASEHLRRDTGADDADLTRKIRHASDAVLTYLKTGSPWLPARDSTGQPIVDSAGDPVYETDSAGDLVLHGNVEAAVLEMIAHLYGLRGTNPDNAYEQDYLPRPVRALLSQFRDPTLE